MSDTFANRNSLRTQIARVVSLVIGAWLVISTFAWPHSHVQQTNTWLVGLFCFVFAIAALNYPGARALNTLLAVWLFLSAFMLPSLDAFTPWHNAILAIILFATSLVAPRSQEPSDLRPLRPV